MVKKADLKQDGRDEESRPQVVSEYPSEGALQGDKPFISEGVRATIEDYGEAIDPFTGKTLTRKDLK